MSAPNVSSLFPIESFGSVVETTAVLDRILRPEGFDKNFISDIATAMFVHNEQMRIAEPSSMHLFAIKKALLYAIPVIASHGSTKGLEITSQVCTPAIRLSGSSIKHIALAIGDKFRLLGFAFPDKMINHLAFSIFPQKYYGQPLDKYKSYPLDIEQLDGIERQTIHGTNIYIINQRMYENVDTFNAINKLIAMKLMEELTPWLASNINRNYTKLGELQRIVPYNDVPFINQINKILERKIDNTYTMALYEALQMTTNWMLYDNIQLLGFASAEVSEKLNYLAYVKNQNYKVRQNIIHTDYLKLLDTRAEKLCKEKYPYFFDMTDKRAIFVRFKRFDINKLPPKEGNDIRILLEKDIQEQEALLHNTCDHIKYIKHLDLDATSDAYKQIEPFIDFDSLGPDGMYSCKLCKYPLICVHTTELHDALLTIVGEQADLNKIYWIKQKVINKFKTINKQDASIQDSETRFTYYCKYCGAELGKSDDIVQASTKTQEESNSYEEHSPYERIVYMNVAGNITLYMNTNTISMSPRMLTTMITMEIKDEIISMVQQSSYNNDTDNAETLLKYLTQIFTLASLISININKVKSPESVLISKHDSDKGSSDVRSELLSAFKIIKAIAVYKQIGVTDDKIKSTLLNAFKYVNRVFSNEEIVIKTISPADKLNMDIRNSPIAHYALFIHNRFENGPSDIMSATGVDMDKLFPKKKTDPRIPTHALYTNIYRIKKSPKNDTERFIQESYQSIVDIASTEPIKEAYLLAPTPIISEFVQDYQSKKSAQLITKRSTPIKRLPVENSREYDFTLKIFQLAYCATGPIREHRWTVSKTPKLEFKCKYCGVDISKVTISNNAKLENELMDHRVKEAFFQLYTLSCPVKDAHTYQDKQCVKCGITKDKISNMDDAYYKKYYQTYMSHRKHITTGIISEIRNIVQSIKPFSELPTRDENQKFDAVKLESISSNLEKILGVSNLISLGNVDGVRMIDIVNSYIQTFYSYYTFARNMSIRITSHPDLEFFKIAKQSIGAKLPELPARPDSTNPDELLLDLLNTILNILSTAGTVESKIIKYIVDKIIIQDKRYGKFDFGKLKAMTVSDDSLLEQEDLVEDSSVEMENDIFNGYDIDGDDMEDNINGYTD